MAATVCDCHYVWMCLWPTLNVYVTVTICDCHSMWLSLYVAVTMCGYNCVWLSLYVIVTGRLCAWLHEGGSPLLSLCIISYLMSSIRSLWHISLKETHCQHIGYSFWYASRDLLYALSHRQDITYTTAFDGPVVDHWLEWKIASWKCIRHAGSIHNARGSKPLQLSALLPELRPTPCNRQCLIYYSVWLSLAVATATFRCHRVWMSLCEGIYVSIHHCRWLSLCMSVTWCGCFCTCLSCCQCVAVTVWPTGAMFGYLSGCSQKCGSDSP